MCRLLATCFSRLTCLSSKYHIHPSLTLLVCLFSHDPNRIVVYICIGFLIITIGAIVIEWLVVDPFLQYVTLFYGVFLGYYACRDIWDDT